MMQDIAKWVGTLIGGLFTGKEPMIWLGVAVEWFRQNEAILEDAAASADVGEMVAVLLAALVFRSQYTPVANR